MKNSSYEDCESYCKFIIRLSVLRLGSLIMENIKVFWKVKVVFEGVGIFNIFFWVKFIELEFNLNDMNISNVLIIIIIFISLVLCCYGSNFYEFLVFNCDSIYNMKWKME